jgi:hypothetical protein
MAIPIPISRTKIATAPWGIPITNEVNRLTTQSDKNTTDVAALKTATATTAWAAVSLLNGWVVSPGSPVMYRKIGDIVYLKGRMQSGAMLQNAFVLPVGFRPPITQQFPCGSADAGGSWIFGLIEIGDTTVGTCAPRAGTNVAFTMNGICFSTT